MKTILVLCIVFQQLNYIKSATKNILGMDKSVAYVQLKITDYRPNVTFLVKKNSTTKMSTNLSPIRLNCLYFSQ